MSNNSKRNKMNNAGGNYSVSEACNDFLSYSKNILSPGAEEFLSDLDGDTLSLHQAFAVNMLAAHAMDYLRMIRTAKGEHISRAALIGEFDNNYENEGAVLSNKKFNLVNLINNSLKHVSLDDRTRDNRVSIAHYGPIKFNALSERNGRIYCILDQYRFDYGRVVLRPVLNALTMVVFSEEDDVVDFASGGWGSLEDSEFDTDDPIDQMIEHCNPLCANCGEGGGGGGGSGGGECECESYIFNGENGRFEPLRSDDYSFNFDEVMSRISGAYSR